MAGFGEPQAGQVREQGPVVGEVVELVPGVQAHGGVQAGGTGAQHRRAGLAAGDLVGQDQLQERGVAHLVLAGQGEPLGQGVGQPAELERLERSDQVGPDRVARPGWQVRLGDGGGGHGWSSLVWWWRRTGSCRRG